MPQRSLAENPSGGSVEVLMNQFQKGILTFFVVVSLLIGLFPPWRYDIRTIHKSIGLHFLFNNIHAANEQGHEYSYYYEPRIDTTKLAVEWITLSLVSLGLFGLAKSISLETLRKVRIPRIPFRKPTKTEPTLYESEEDIPEEPGPGISSWLKKFIK